MQLLIDLWNNDPLKCAALSWTVAQTLKVLISLGLEKHLDWKRMWGMGGMPSSHTAFVTALTMRAGLQAGFDSLTFAVCFVVLFIVMTDAIGVRRETGRQGSAINLLLDWFDQETEPETESVDLKERVGHSPQEVFVGFLWGIVTALIFEA